MRPLRGRLHSGIKTHSSLKRTDLSPTESTATRLVVEAMKMEGREKDGVLVPYEDINKNGLKSGSFILTIVQGKIKKKSVGFESFDFKDGVSGE